MKRNTETLKVRLESRGMSCVEFIDLGELHAEVCSFAGVRWRTVVDTVALDSASADRLQEFEDTIVRQAKAIEEDI